MPLVTVADAPTGGARAGASTLFLGAVDGCIGIQFVADAHTPPEDTGYAGQIAMIPAGDLAALVNVPTDVAHLPAPDGTPVRGYHTTGGPTGHQWLMTSPLSVATAAALDAMPTNGWVNAAAAKTYRDAAARLIGTFGVTDAEALAVLAALYAATVADLGRAP